MKTALLLIAHGSRNAEANQDLRDVASAFRESGEYSFVEPSFLELAEPDIDGAASRCVVHGAKCVILLPYFLSAGVHVRRDLQSALQRLGARFPTVDFRLAEPLGPHPMLLQIARERARAARPTETSHTTPNSD